MVMSGIGLAAALALWTWLGADPEVVAATGDEANANAGLQPTDPNPPPVWSTPATPATAPSEPSTARPIAATAILVPITVVAPRKLLVGETDDLVISVGAGANEVSFNVQFDANVLQVRSGTEGGWAVGAGPNARFVAEIPEEADRVQIRSVATGQRAGMPGGTVAAVRLHAVGAGTTSLLVTDVVVKDSAGRSMATSVSASNLQMTVDPAPPRQPEAVSQRGDVAVETPAEATEVGD
jgi:hypothetical protein